MGKVGEVQKLQLAVGVVVVVVVMIRRRSLLVVEAVCNCLEMSADVCNRLFWESAAAGICGRCDGGRWSQCRWTSRQ